MTEIKVILNQESLLDLGVLSREERDLLFDQLANDNPSIPRHIIDSFIDMQNEILKETSRSTKPDLKELLLRKTIQLAQNHGSEFNTVVIPIIPSFTQGVLRRVAPADNIKTKKTGGAIPPMRRMKPQSTPQPREEIPFAVKIRFDMQILAVTSSGVDYIVPPNEEINVIGIIINPICNWPQILDSHGRLKKLDAIHIHPPTVGDRVVLGNYTYPIASAACDDYFIRPNYALTIAGETLTGPTKVLFADLDEEKISRVLGTVFDYLSSIEEYHQSLAAAIHVHTQVDAALSEGRATQTIRPALRDEIKEIMTPHPIARVQSEAPEKTDILTVLESLHKGMFSTVYSGATLADIDMRGFSRIYYKSILKGKDDSIVLEQLDKYREKQARVAFANSIKAKLLDERNKLNAYRIIIEKKFGTARLAEIEHELAKKPSITVSAVNILDLLKPAERKPVQTEFERRQKYLEAVINNKCPHVKLYRQFRLARDDERAKKMYAELTKFFKNPNETNGMIQCNNCGFDIICPHMREFTEMDFAGKFHADIKAKLTKYIDKAVVKDQYYCRICGEMISSLEAFGDIGQTRDPSSMMNEELKSFMWGEMAILSKYLKFGNLVNVPQLITAMRDACYPYIFEIEKQILKSKTNSADEIKAKKRLFITIYAFAYMIHLILSNKGKFGENEISFKNFKPKNSKNIIVDMIRHSLEIIIMSRNVIIREIPGMTADLIKNKLIEAYKSMQSTGTQVITYSGEAEDLLITLLLDPAYKYIYLVNLIDDILAGKKPSKSKFDMVDRVDVIMGEPIAKLEKSDDVFAKIKIPRFDARWDLKKFDDIKPLHKGNALPGGKSIWKDAQPGYIARSFDVFADKIKNRLYIEPMYVDISASGREDPNAPMDVKFREPFEKHHAKYLEIENKEQKLYQYKLMESAKAFSRIKTKNTRRWTNPNVSLGRLYDEDGNPHKWDVYVVEKTVEKPTRVELKAGDIARATESGTIFTDKIIDRKCSTCGILWSHCDKLSEKKIRESLNAKYTVNNFFRFYENRCPKGALHDFSDGGTCSKCGIINTYILNPTSKNSMTYYREFHGVYLRERDEFAAIGDVFTNTAPKPVSDVSKYASDYTNWSFNFNVVLELANKVKVNHRLLSALGAVERQEYAEIQSGAYIPPETEQRTDTRIYLIDSHVKNLITEYNQVRFFHKLVKPSIDLSQLIDNSGINKHRIAELGKKLPDIFDDYNLRFAHVQRHKKPREIVSFVLQTFCEMCLKIWNDGEKETEKLRHDFVEYFVKKVLRAEELLSKPGYFNWSLLYGDKDAKEKELYDSNFSKDFESEKDRDYGDAEKEGDDFGDTIAPLSADGFDVESDPDRDPFDDDDNDANDWKVGEDRGL